MPRSPITPDHIEHLVRHGYAIIPGFLGKSELAKAQKGMLEYFPSVAELKRTPNRFGGVFEDPEHLQIEFPFASDHLNHISTHPLLLAFAQSLLGTNDLRLSQSAIWAKYAGTGDFEQGLHLDYQGNTLVVPRDDGAYRQINLILYYTDVDETLGPTHVVSQEKTRDLPLWPTHRTRLMSPSLYKHEVPVLARAGDLLIFSMKTWHRASAISAEQGARFTHHMVYRSAEANFQGYHLWSRLGENLDLQRFIQKATPVQRQALGFPKPKDPYWNEQTLKAVALRYPWMDLTPYRS